MKLPESLAASEYAPLVVGLLAVARADGKITSEERSLIRGLLDEIGVSLPQAEMEALLALAPDAVWVGRSVTDAVERRFLVRQALLLSLEDGEQAADEVALATTWAASWGLEGELDAIKVEVAAFVQRRSEVERG